jgi:hypothetical protein
MNHKLHSFFCELPALAGFADAQIHFGDGKAAVGSLTNHGLIVGIVATAPAPLDSLTLPNDLIEILYAAASLDPDADSDGNGLPDAWGDGRFSGRYGRGFFRVGVSPRHSSRYNEPTPLKEQKEAFH